MIDAEAAVACTAEGRTGGAGTPTVAKTSMEAMDGEVADATTEAVNTTTGTMRRTTGEEVAASRGAERGGPSEERGTEITGFVGHFTEGAAAGGTEAAKLSNHWHEAER